MCVYDPLTSEKPSEAQILSAERPFAAIVRRDASRARGARVYHIHLNVGVRLLDPAANNAGAAAKVQHSGFTRRVKMFKKKSCAGIEAAVTEYPRQAANRK